MPGCCSQQLVAKSGADGVSSPELEVLSRMRDKQNASSERSWYHHPLGSTYSITEITYASFLQ